MTYEDINIIFEDNHLLVVVKPQNVPVCPDESGDLDLLTMLKQYRKNKEKKVGEAYLGLVHRLDRVTGGAMVFAKTSKCAERLSEAIREREMGKKYLAVLCGEPNEKKGTLVHHLLKNEKENIVEVVPMATEGAKRAELNYRVLSSVKGYSLVEVDLVTGRSHQIRAQFASLNTPVFGDAKYGGDKTPKAPYIALWAAELRLTHPVSKENMVFRVYPPTDTVPWKAFKMDNILEIDRPSGTLYDALNIITE